MLLTIVPIVAVAALVTLWFVVHVGGRTAVRIVPSKHQSSLSSVRPPLTTSNAESTEWIGLIVNRLWGAAIEDAAVRLQIEEAINGALRRLISRRESGNFSTTVTAAPTGAVQIKKSVPKFRMECYNARVKSLSTRLPFVSSIRLLVPHPAGGGLREGDSGASGTPLAAAPSTSTPPTDLREVPSPSANPTSHPSTKSPRVSVDRNGGGGDGSITFDCEVVFEDGNGLSLTADGGVSVLSRSTKWSVEAHNIVARVPLCISLTLAACSSITKSERKERSGEARRYGTPSSVRPPSSAQSLPSAGRSREAKTEQMGVPVAVGVSLLGEPELSFDLETTIGDPWTVRNLCLVPMALQWLVPSLVRRLLHKMPPPGPTALKPSLHGEASPPYCRPTHQKEVVVHLPQVDWAAFVAATNSSSDDDDACEDDSLLLSSSPVSSFE